MFDIQTPDEEAYFPGGTEAFFAAMFDVLDGSFALLTVGILVHLLA